MASPQGSTGAKPPGKSSLRLRILSALVMIPAALLLFYLGGWILGAGLLLAGILMYHEWLGMTGGEARATGAVFMIGLLATLVLVIVGRFDVAWLVALATVPAVAAAAASKGRSPVWAAAGAFYVLIPLAAILWLRVHHPQGFQFTVWLLAVVWATDIGAFFVGSRLRGPKLAPRISPNKTWSGLLGGMVAAGLVAMGLGLVFGLPLAPLALALLGAALAAWSQMGDLTESAVKRRFGVKDSGSIIPGHGGILDRVDGLVFAAPAVALTLALL